MSLHWTNGQVVRKTIWAPGLFTLTVRAPDVKSFEPGQFLHLQLKGPEKSIHRPYSVASPHGPMLDFFIVLVEGGLLTEQLWRLEVGDSVEVSENAAGGFVLSKAPTGNTLWLIATGTGIAPYIAMLRTDTPWSRYEKIVVVHGVRYLSDLAYRIEFEQHATKFGERFRYIPVVSREQGKGTQFGRITTVVKDGNLEEAAGETFSAARSVVMLCGNPEMLNEMEELLEAKGLSKHRAKTPGQILAERYW